MKLPKKHRTTAESLDLSLRLYAGILAEKPMKDLGRELGIAEAYVYSLARRRFGFEKMLLTPNERAVIRRIRIDAQKKLSRQKKRR